MLAAQLRPGAEPAVPRPASHAFLTTFLLTAVNPMTLIMFAGVVPQLPVAGSPLAAAGFALALAAGSASVGVTVGGVGAALGRALPGERGRRAISAAAATGIIAFGIAGLAGA
jgi:threonine/homoserine/homoserine lactone efflux protein